MAGIIAIYVALLVVFLIISSLIFRHSIKFSYLSPRFRMVTGIFGLVALSIIILSLYLLITLGRVSQSGPRGFSGGGSSSNGLQF